jgi:hypothetical protein
MTNIVYVLTNEVMPGLVKIGRTDANDVLVRMSQLNTTGVPLPFECYFAAEVKDSQKLEQTLHKLFSDNRINPKREFFRVEPEKVVLAISIGEFSEITPGIAVVDEQEKEALEKAKSRRPNLKLEALGIRTGDVLTCSRDENITAIVTEGGRVIFDGENMSLSAAALKALHSLGYTTPTASGSGYWMFEGELLDERRVRIESSQFDEI